jgi:hypothetical protein
MGLGEAPVDEFRLAADLTAHEERRLRGLLGALRDAGIILTASLEPALPGCGFAEAVEDLRGSIGAHLVGTALAWSDCPVPGPDPEPAAVMPVWAFEPEDGSDDVLISSARLWGTDLFVEALRVEDDDHPEPVPSVRERFTRWIAAAGQGETPMTVRLPGRDGAYVIFAAAAPA